MKKLYSILTALALVTLYSCSSDELVGDKSLTTDATASGAISFGAGSSAMTRANFYGATAAGKLGGKFVVYGTKHEAAEDKTAANDKVVYNNFQVAYTANSAGQTESNTSGWEYVGLQAYDNTPTQQGIKYWDYSANNGHTFYAFSSPQISYPKNETTDKVIVTKTKADENSLYNKGYAVTLKTGADLTKLYFSDRVPVAEADYEKTVSFTFRNIGTLVRVGFYETIPGYTVKIDNFYIDNSATTPVTSYAAMNTAKTDGFYASLQNVKHDVDQTLNVTYYDNTNATIENRPKLTQPTGGYDYTLKLGSSSIIGATLGTSSSAPTWACDYTPVYPFEANSNPLLLKLDFTMTADDGSGDIIKVRGARAIVPAEYVQWKSNFAYTYLFKISDKTNGTTGDVNVNGDPVDPTGLKPITFDAITVDITEELQETISSISTNSITTYAEGKIVNEYTASKPIYVSISDTSTGAVITPSGLGNTDGKAQVYKLNKAATEAEVLAQLTGSPMGITFDAQTATVETTVPLTDGTTPSIANVKFTPSSVGTYAYVYTTTAYVAPTYAVQSSESYTSGETYYMRSGLGTVESPYVFYAVSVTTEAAFNENKANLYLQTNAGTPGVYDVKVIKVQ